MELYPQFCTMHVGKPKHRLINGEASPTFGHTMQYKPYNYMESISKEMNILLIYRCTKDQCFRYSDPVNWFKQPCP